VNGWVVIDGADDVFDALAENHRIRRDAEVRELALIAQACDEYTVDEGAAGKAAEKLIEGGAPGTALVGEFLALELAGLLQISPVAAACRIAETLDLRDRHPELGATTLAGGAPPWWAVRGASRTSAAGLAAEAAGWVDHQLGVSLAIMPWTRASRLLAGLIVKADTALAAERARQKRQARMVCVGEHADGGSTLYARLDTEHALALADTISDLANALAAAGNTEPADARRATALGLLADPRAAHDLLGGFGDGRPANRAATLVIHVAADTLTTSHTTPGVARLEGVGPLDTGTLRRFLPDSHVTVRPVIDLNTIPAVDAYEVPERLRAHILARNPVEVFPFSARPAHGLDLDHTLPYDHHAPAGSLQTRAGNLGPLSRKVHRAKTARLWTVEQTDPGDYLWTSPHGFRYLVTPDGTIALGRDPHRPSPRATAPLARTG